MSDNPYQSPQEGQYASRASRLQRGKRVVFSSVNVLGKVLAGLYVALMLASIGSMVTNYNLAALYQKSLRGQELTVELEEPVLLNLRIASIFEIVVYLAVVVTFITWFYKSYKNLLPLGAKRLDPTAGWAIGSWFVPLLNLYRPYVIGKELWIVSNPEGVREGRRVRNHGTGPVLVWWLPFVVMVITDRVLTQVDDARKGTSQIELLKNAISNSNGAIVLEVIRFVACITAIYFVLTVSRWQDERYDLLCEQAENAPPVEPADERNPFENFP